MHQISPRYIKRLTWMFDIIFVALILYAEHLKHTSDPTGITWLTFWVRLGLLIGIVAIITRWIMEYRTARHPQ